MTALLRIEGLIKEFPVRDSGRLSGSGRKVRAVDEVSLEVGFGECVALVGESGSGKSTLARCALALSRPTAGRILFDGTDLFSLRPDVLRRRRRQLQMIFQDPASSLSPRRTVGQTLAEPLEVHNQDSASEHATRVLELLEMVELPAGTAEAYPHELSGGERQRVAIARALATRPRLLVADEPVSALDVSLRGQILGLLERLRQRFEIAVLLISHDLALVETMADRVAVMYAGRIVEQAATDLLLAQPLHPYTVMLLAASADPSPLRPQIGLRQGEPADLLRLPKGCAFHPRCARAEEHCRIDRPALEECAAGRLAACFLAGGQGPEGSPAASRETGQKMELSGRNHVGTNSGAERAAMQTPNRESE